MLLASAAQIREADRVMIEDLGYPGLLLMESAGRLSSERILQRFPAASFCILAGPGNNGGDGLVIARYLAAAGRFVQILLSHPASQYKGDAALVWAALNGSGIAVNELELDILGENARQTPLSSMPCSERVPAAPCAAPSPNSLRQRGRRRFPWWPSTCPAASTPTQVFVPIKPWRLS